MTSPSLARPSCRLSLIWSSSPAETRPLALEIILGCLPMTGSDPLPSWHFPPAEFLSGVPCAAASVGSRKALGPPAASQPVHPTSCLDSVDGPPDVFLDPAA